MRATLLRKLTVTHCSLFCPFPLDLGAADLKNLIPFRLLREAVRIWTLQFLLHQSNSVHPWGAQVTWINWVPCQVSFKQFNLGTRDSCKFLLQNREWHQHIAWTMPCHGKYRGFFKLPWSCHLCREWKLPKSGGSPADLLLTANGMNCQDSYDDSHYIYIYIHPIVLYVGTASAHSQTAWLGSIRTHVKLAVQDWKGKVIHGRETKGIPQKLVDKCNNTENRARRHKLQIN